MIELLKKIIELILAILSKSEKTKIEEEKKETVVTEQQKEVSGIIDSHNKTDIGRRVDDMFNSSGSDDNFFGDGN